MINVDDVLINRLAAISFAALCDNDLMNLKFEIKRTLAFLNNLSDDEKDCSMAPNLITTVNGLRDDAVCKNRFDFFMNINECKDQYVIV